MKKREKKTDRSYLGKTTKLKYPEMTVQDSGMECKHCVQLRTFTR